MCIRKKKKIEVYMTGDKIGWLKQMNIQVRGTANSLENIFSKLKPENQLA